MSDTPELTDYSRGFIEGRKASLAEREAEVERRSPPPTSFHQGRVPP